MARIGIPCPVAALTSPHPAHPWDSDVLGPAWCIGNPTAEAQAPADAAALHRAQVAEAKLARLDQMATAWEERFPDSIRTVAVVDAIRTVIHPEP